MAEVSGQHKIKKPRGEEPSEFEQQVAHEIYNVQNSNAAIKADLRGLHIVGARRVELKSGRHAVIVFVPFPQLKEYRKIQRTLIEELEKKFTDHHVVLIAQRTVLSKHCTRSNRHHGPRPRNRTLTHVQDAILDDVVYPAEIVGKRIRVRVDGSKLYKVHLSPKDRTYVQDKLDTFAGVYKLLTNKDVAYEFPARS